MNRQILNRCMVAGCWFSCAMVVLLGWAPWLVEGMSALAISWCGLTLMLGLVCLTAAEWAEGLSRIAATVCQGVGLLGTVVGFMIALNAQGTELIEQEGLYTALSTTAVGMVMAILLSVQAWLLREEG